MISKRISSRKDGKSSAHAAFRYGEGLSPGRTGIERIQDKSHRTRIGNFGLVDDGVYIGRGAEEMGELLALAATEMQANCDLNTRVATDKKIAHFVISFSQNKPSDVVLRDTEDSMLAALKLENNHFASFTHSDNGFWHLHMFVSRIDKVKRLGNPLWQDKTIRDRVCREIEIRHKLDRDNGLHFIDEAGQIVEVPRAVRQYKREQKNGLGDRAITTEKYSGEKSFQTWVTEIRLGDHIKHAESWQDLHASAAAYGCEIKQKGAGFVVCPIGEKGGIQLSKIGLKNLPTRLGVFEPLNAGLNVHIKTAYKPSPIDQEGASHYAKWQSAKSAYLPVKAEKITLLRVTYRVERKTVRSAQFAELKAIRGACHGEALRAAISVAKMKHAASMTLLSERYAIERHTLYVNLNTQGPGYSYKEYLIKEAGKGDTVATGLIRKLSFDQATEVDRERERNKLKVTATIAGYEYRATPLMRFSYRVETNGTIVYDFGKGRVITDSSISRKIQLNTIAASDPMAIETALRYAMLKFGNRLILTGPSEFQRFAVEVAVNKGLRIIFDDPVLEKYRNELIVKRQQSSNFITMEIQNAFNHPIQHIKQIPPAPIRNRLHDLSLGDLVLNTERDVMSLRQDVPHRMEQQQERGNNDMQRSAGRIDGTSRARAVISNISTGATSAYFHKSTSWIERAIDKGQRIDVPIVHFTHKAQEQEQLTTAPIVTPTALEWATGYSKDKNKKIVDPSPGDGVVKYTVIYIGPDSIVLDKGLTISIHSKPDLLEFKVGCKVTIGKEMEIILLQKNRGDSVERF
jgi:hypothetical protein